MYRSYKWISIYIIISMTQNIWIKKNKNTKKHYKNNNSKQIFNYIIWIHIYKIILNKIYSYIIIWPISVQIDQMNYNQSKQNKRQKKMQWKKPSQSWITNRITPPQLNNDLISYKRNSGKQVGNYSSTPKWHLTLRQNITHKSNNYH